jgi:hypothetical protein
LPLILNGWRVTRDTQPERKMVCLESGCYNPSHLSPKLIASLRLDECKPFLVCFQVLPDFPKYYLRIVHFQPSEPIGLLLSSRHTVVVS